VSPEQRKAIMNNQILGYCNRGYRIVSQGDDPAMIVRGHRPNHILHLLLSVVTR
jgi:hypothetical protein